MSQKTIKSAISRRQLLGGAAATVGGMAAAPLAGSAESNPANLPPNVSEWEVVRMFIMKIMNH